MLKLGIEHKDRVWSLGEVSDTGKVALKFDEFPRLEKRLLLRHGVELTRVAHALIFLHLVDALRDGLEVGQHATQPTLVYVGHATLLGVRLDRVLYLALGSHEHDRSTVRGEIAHECVCIFQTIERLVEIDDVNAVALAVNEPLHFRVPTSGLVSEMDTRVKELLHRDDCHVFFPSPRFWRREPMRRSDRGLSSRAFSQLRKAFEGGQLLPSSRLAAMPSDPTVRVGCLCPRARRTAQGQHMTLCCHARSGEGPGPLFQ